MFGSPVFDVAIGLVFIYCLYSLLATTINEIIASILGLRGKKLEHALRRMLTDDKITGWPVEWFWVRNLMKIKSMERFFAKSCTISMDELRELLGKHGFFHMTPAVFTATVMDYLKKQSKKLSKSKDPVTIGKINEILDTIDTNGNRTTICSQLKSFAAEKDATIETFKEKLEKWFDKISMTEGRLFTSFFDNPMIKYMSANDGLLVKKKPSYISPAFFSKAIMDSLKNLSNDRDKDFISPDTITSALRKLSPDGSSDTVRLLKSFLDDANNDLQKFRTLLEQWFDSMMERAGGWYKRQAQGICFFIGLAIAVSFNVDTIKIVKYLSKDDKAREQIVNLATNYVKNHPAGVKNTTVKSPNNPDIASTEQDSIVLARLNSLFNYADSIYQSDIKESNGILGLGWKMRPHKIPTGKNESLKVAGASPNPQIKNQIIEAAEMDTFFTIGNLFNFKHFLGWLLTALAVSFGAPFWFELLNKLVQLRGTGGKPEEKTQTVKKDETAIIERKG